MTRKSYKLEDVWKHITTINGELGSVKTDMKYVKKDMIYVKKKMDKLDSRLWYLLAGIAITLFSVIVSHIF